MSARRRRTPDQPHDTVHPLSAVLDHVQAGLLVEDRHRRVILVNARLRHLLGMPPARRQPARRTTVPPRTSSLFRQCRRAFKDPAGFVRRVGRIVREGVAVTGEELLMADGRVLERDYAPLDLGGGARGHLWSYRDITARKRNEQRLAFALATTEHGVWDWDVPSGVVLFARPRSVEGALSVEYVQARAADWDREVHPDDVAFNRVRVAAVVAGEAEQFRMVSRQRRAGWAGYRLVESQGKVVDRDARGRAVRLIGTFADVTERAAREQEERARQTAVEHAAHLAMLGELASGLAHELNQPLAALAGYAQAAERFLRAGDRRQALASMRQTVAMAEKGAEIVRRLRGLVRRSAPVAERFELVALAEDVLRLVRDEAAKGRVEVAVSAPARLRVEGDRIQLEQLLLNLVRNALESFPPEQPPPHRITLALGRRGRSLAAVSVADNGPGVAPGAAGRIFEPFFTTKPTGTGLGLCISKSIAEAHGGSLRLEPRPAGACFVVELPLRRRR